MAQLDSITELPNGLKLITRAMNDTESLTIHVFIRAGGRNEDQLTENGVSHFLEHLLFKGTEHYPTPQAISEAIDRVGGYINAYTTEELTTFFVKLPRQHFKIGLSVLADLVQRPLFDDVEIDRERDVIVEEMKVYHDDPAQHVFDYVGGLLWPSDSLRTDVLGSEHVIRTIPREIIEAYHAATYRPNNAVVAVAGNISPEAVVELTKTYFGGWGAANTRQSLPAEGSLSQTENHIVIRDTAQAHLVVAGRAVGYQHPDEYALRVLCGVLGVGMSSRLHMNIRERLSLAYSINMRLTNFTDTGKWEIYAGVNAAKVEAATQAISHELDTIRSQIVPDSELAKVKEQLKSQIIMGQETNGAVADRIGSELLLTNNVRTISNMLAAIDSVSAEAVQRVAQLYLDPSGIRIAAIAPASTEAAFRRESLMTLV